MSRTFLFDAVRNKLRETAVYIQVAVLILAGFTPLITLQSAQAAQLTSRSVAISTSEPEKTGVNYNFTFTYPSSTVAGVKLQFCKTPLGTCELPGTNSASSTYTTPRPMSLSSTTLASDSMTGTSTPITSSTGTCNDVTGGSHTMYCFSKTTPTAAGGSPVTVNLANITNPGLPNNGTSNTSNYATVYVRIALFNNADFASANQIHEGTVATSINQQLTVSGRVQEKLNFCVAAVDDGGATDTGLPTNVATCSVINDSVIDLGVIDNTSVAKSPVPSNPPNSLGNAKYGLAMLNTNAAGGVSIGYYAEADTTGTQQQRAFRVPGATCSATTSLVDQCFESASPTGTVMTNAASTSETFGMNVACTVPGTTTTNFAGQVTSSYNNGSTTNSAADGTAYVADCENANTTTGTTPIGAKYAWNATGSSVTLVSSPTVVDNEAIKFNFAAKAAATTPTGAYTVRTTFIATPIF